MLHKSSDDSIVRNNDVYSNFDAGLSLVETSRCVVTGNTFKDNRWGVRIILGSTDNVVSGIICVACAFCLWQGCVCVLCFFLEMVVVLFMSFVCARLYFCIM